MSTPNEKERARRLMMSAIDSEIREKERSELAGYLKKYPELEEEFKDFKNLKEITMNVNYTPPPESVWDKYWLGVYNKLERGIGWILFSLGAVVLLIYGLYLLIESILVDVEIAWWLKIAIFSVIAGAVMLLVSVIREKVFLHKSERYKDIKR